MPPYKIEQWSDRGISSVEADTKREANRLASLMRGDPRVAQTIVTFPNGKVRVCRNSKAKATKA